MTVRWSIEPDKRDWLIAFVPGHSVWECIAAFEERYGIRLTVGQVKNFKQHFKVKSGTTGNRFKKGDVPFIKGKSWADFPNSRFSRDTCFKPGNVPWNGKLCPVGSESIRGGYVHVKVAPLPSGKKAHDNWKPRARVAWEKAYGPVPEGYKLIHLDHDRMNDGLGNLALVSNADWAVIRARKLEYHDAETFANACAIAKLTQGITSAEKRARKARRD